MPFLIIQESETFPARILELPLEGELSIGRGINNSLVLSDTQVSRRHAGIKVSGGEFILEDYGSSCGTSLNGQKLTAPKKLSYGDRMKLGNCLLILSETASATPVQQQKESPEPKAIPAREPSPSAPPATPPGAGLLFGEGMVALKQKIHENILARMNLHELATTELEDSEMRNKLTVAMEQTLRELRHEIPPSIDLAQLRQALMDELVGFGPISPLLRDEEISEIMVNGPTRVFIERKGKLAESGVRFYDGRHLMNIIQRIVEPLGRHIDEASPMVDARLPDGSRVNAIIPPLALDGASVTIRKFAKNKLTSEGLIRFGSMTPEMDLFLQEAVRARQNIVVSGGTGSGKTTLLNMLSLYIPQDERVVTIEDSAELKLSHSNLVRLESRPPNIEGKGRIAIRDLVINALRMRPDRIVVGECRGAEALDMLQAMNTGHDGSLTTLHANSPRDAIMRLENMVLMTGFELPTTAIREQISSAVDLIIQQTRMLDGSRKIVQISEITGREGDVVLMQDIFVYEQTGIDEFGKLQGRFVATGNIPRFIENLRKKGDLRVPLSVFSKNAG